MEFYTLHLQIHLNLTIYIHNIYNLTLNTTYLWGCISFLKKVLSAEKRGEYIVWGNFNLHHPVWENVNILTTNPNSKNLLRVVENHDLKLLLRKGTINYEKAGHQSIIDLVFVLSFILESLISYKVAKKIDYGSDYYPVIICLTFKLFKKKNNWNASLRKQTLQSYWLL